MALNDPNSTHATYPPRADPLEPSAVGGATDPGFRGSTFYTVSWTYPALKADARLLGFDVVIFTGSDPDLATARLAPLAVVNNPAARDAVFKVPSLSSGSETVNGCVRARFASGTGAWSALPGAPATGMAQARVSIARGDLANAQDAAVVTRLVAPEAVQASALTSGQANTDNLWPNPTSEVAPPTGADAASAEWKGRTASGSAYAGSYVREVTADFIRLWVPCLPGESYALSAQARRTAGASDVALWLSYYQADKLTQVGSTVASAAAGAAWGEIMVTGTAPSGAAWVVLALVAGAGTTGQFDACYARKQVSASDLEADVISSSDYAEDAYGTPTSGARLRNVYAAATAWATATAVTAGEHRTHGGRVYRCHTSGTTHDGTAPAAWVYTTTYAAGARVSFGLNTYVSLQAGNLNHLPYDGKNGTDAWWRCEGAYTGPSTYTGLGIPDGTAVWDQVVPLSVSPDGLQIGVASWNEAAIAGNIIYSGSFVYNLNGDARFDYSAGGNGAPLRVSRIAATNTILVEYMLPAGRDGSIGALFMSERYNSNGASPKGWTLVRGMGTDPAPAQPAGWGYSFGQMINSGAAVQTPAAGYRMSLLVALF